MILSDRNAEIKKQVKKDLDRYRYQHTLGVAYTAVCLAMKYGADIDDAFLAGLLHDCAKNVPDEYKLELCKKYRIKVSAVEKKAPTLLHAKLGAYFADKKYGVHDADILNAVRYHTTGRPGMSLLEKIIYTADYIEPNRDRADQLTEIRQLAFEDLDRCVFRIAEETAAYVDRKNKGVMDPATLEVRDYYRKVIEDREEKKELQDE